MTIAKIDRCKVCFDLEFLDADGECEWCCKTSEILYSTGFIAACTPPAPVDGNKTEAA